MIINVTKDQWKRTCFAPLILVLFSAGAWAQTVLNGDFETNTAPGCSLNLLNSTFNSYMSNTDAYGAGDELDIMNTSCGYGAPESGSWFIALANTSGSAGDALTLTLSAPLVSGKTYSLCYYDRAVDTNGCCPPGVPLQVGLSTTSGTQGTVFYTSPIPTIGTWTQRLVSFVAPNSGQYLSFQAINQTRWTQLDNVSLNACCPPFTFVSAVKPSSCGSNGSASVIVSGGIGPYTYSWNTIPVQTNDTATGLAAGTYTVIATDSIGCIDSTTVTIAGIPPPVVTILPLSATICNGQTITLSASGAASYQWSPSTGLSSVTDSIVNSNPGSTTTYTLIGTSGGCADTVQRIVTVNPLPVITVSPPSSSICAGESVSLLASGANTYLWNPSTGLSATNVASVTANPVLSTVYTVAGTDQSGCIDSTTVLVTVDSLPGPSFTATISDFCNQSVQFINTSSGAATYLWNFGDNTTGIVPSPAHTYLLGGSYIVKLIATSPAGCIDSTSQTVVVFPSANIVVTPNAFTPNGDGINDVYTPSVFCSSTFTYLLRIYDRWGELVFESSDPTKGWDGTFSGQPEPVDVYVYYLQYSCETCSGFKKGNITLLR